MLDHCKFDSFLTKFSAAVTQNSIDKLMDAGEDIEQLKNRAKQ